jgi:hypothetical protein
MKPILFFWSLLFLVACGVNKNQPSADVVEGPKTQADSLLQEVIDGHDVAMPKMKKLERLMKEASRTIDSIEKLPFPLQEQNQELKVALLFSVNDLKNADSLMHAWMNGFKYDSLENNEPERIKYLQDQKTAVNNMKNAVLNSISKTEGVLNQK